MEIRVCVDVCMYVPCICKYVSSVVLCAVVVEVYDGGSRWRPKSQATPRRWSWVDREVAAAVESGPDSTAEV